VKSWGGGYSTMFMPNVENLVCRMILLPYS
jgi:hypothetical protein